MIQNWVQTELEKVCSIDYGSRVVRKRDQGIIYPVYGGGGKTFYLDRYNREDQLVIARFGMSEKCTRFVSGKFFLNDSGLTLSAFREEEMDRRFLDYLMISKNDEIYSIGRGTAQKNLDMEPFKKLKICFPKSLIEQKRIVAILDEAFAGIDQAIANTEKNLVSAAELFAIYIKNIFQASSETSTKKLASELFVTITPKIKVQRKAYLNKGSYPIISQEAEHINGYWDNLDHITPTEGPVVIFGDHTRCLKYIDFNFVVGADGTKILQSREGINARCLFYALTSINLEGKGYARHFNALKKASLFIPECIEEQIRVANSCGALEDRLNDLIQSYKKKATLLNALKQRLLQKAFSGELTTDKRSNNIIPFPRLTPDELHVGILAYTYRKHEGTTYFNTFRRTKSEKIIHLIEYQTGLDLQRHAIPMARGPYDMEARMRVESEAEAGRYFQTYEMGDGSFAIRRLEKFDAIAEQAAALFGDKKTEIDRIIDLFLPMNHEEVEIPATVYAAWNNLLIDGENISDDRIVTAARDEWHEEKMKILRQKFINAIRWLEKNDLVPKGRGKRVGDRRLI